MINKVVYTAIFGEYEPLKELKRKYKEKGIDYICFTNNKDILNMKSNWKIIFLDIEKPDNWNNSYAIWDNHFMNREIKINIEKYLNNYDFSLYIDGSFKVVNKLLLSTVK